MDVTYVTGKSKAKLESLLGKIKNWSITNFKLILPSSLKPIIIKAVWTSNVFNYKFSRKRCYANGLRNVKKTILWNFSPFY